MIGTTDAATAQDAPFAPRPVWNVNLSVIVYMSRCMRSRICGASDNQCLLAGNVHVGLRISAYVLPGRCAQRLTSPNTGRDTMGFTLAWTYGSLRGRALVPYA